MRDLIQEVKILLGKEDAKGEDDLLNLLISNATDEVLDEIGRDTLPERLGSVVSALAVIAYNRLGTEGEKARSEGAVSLSYVDDLPAALRSRLKNYPRKVWVMRDEAEEKVTPSG